MRRWVVDTNVPIVANGRPDPGDARLPSLSCRLNAVRFLQRLLNTDRVLIDLAGEIQTEYRTYLNPNGQPGVGDRFYQEVLHSAPSKVERIDLPKLESGEYADLPQPVVDAGFDPSDRKFAALAHKEQVPVANATDSDWLFHRNVLEANGVRLNFVCGQQPQGWFDDADT